jgi:hypothetical protein
MCGDGDGDGDGGGARCCCCCRSVAGAENSEEDASVARHNDGGLARSEYCGACATEEGANMLPRRLCEFAETLLVLALTLAPLTEGGDCITGAGGVNWTTGSGAALISRSA